LPALLQGPVFAENDPPEMTGLYDAVKSMPVSTEWLIMEWDLARPLTAPILHQIELAMGMALLKRCPQAQAGASLNGDDSISHLPPKAIVEVACDTQQLVERGCMGQPIAMAQRRLGEYLLGVAGLRKKKAFLWRCIGMEMLNASLGPLAAPFAYAEAAKARDQFARSRNAAAGISVAAVRTAGHIAFADELKRHLHGLLFYHD
jgi:hypothetical protein